MNSYDWSLAGMILAAALLLAGAFAVFYAPIRERKRLQREIEAREAALRDRQHYVTSMAVHDLCVLGLMGPDHVRHFEDLQ